MAPVGPRKPLNAVASPVFCDVFQRFSQGRLGRDAGAVVGEPSLEGGDLRRGLVLADGQTRFGRQTPDPGFDLVERGDALQPVLGDRRGAVSGDFKQFAVRIPQKMGMGPAIGKPDGRTSPVGLDQTVIPGIAVRRANSPPGAVDKVQESQKNVRSHTRC